MTSVAQLASTLQTIFTTTAERLGRTTGFVHRRSKLNGALFAQALVFGWLANPQATLEGLAQTAAAAGVRISPQGLDQRCTEAAAIFLEELLGAAVQAVIAAEPVVIPLLQRFSAVILLDSSTIVLPEAVATWWPGCGGSSSVHTAASLKIHVRYDLCAGTLRGPLLTDGRTHESTTAFQTAPLPPKALRIADLGYFALAVLATIAQEGSYFLSRLHRTTALFDQSGQRLDLCSFLTTADTMTLDLPVTLGVHDRIPARLLALRVPADVSNQRRRRARAAARTHGRTPSAQTLTLCDWTLLLTNAPMDSLSLTEALILLRSRWQIELLFKLWKDQGKIDESRSAKHWRVMCEVFAKLLAMVVQHWIFLVSCWSYPDRSLVKAAQSVRQHMVPFVSALTCPVLLCRALQVIARCLAAGCRINHRKKKPNTFQFLLDPTLLNLP